MLFHFSKSLFPLTALLTVSALGLLVARPAQAQDGLDVTTAQTISSGTYTGSNSGYGVAITGTAVVITGGTFTGGAGVYSGAGGYADSSSVTISGGSFTGGFGSFEAGSGFEADNGSTVAITGGTFTGGFGYLGGYDISAQNGSAITIYGTGFDVGYGPLGPAGVFTGTLADGETESIYYFSSGGSSIVLAAPVATVPEPSPVVIFGLGGSALTGLMLWAKKRRTLSA